MPRLLATLDSRIVSAREQFSELLQNLSENLDSVRFVSQGKGDKGLENLHLPRKLMSEIAAAVREEKRDLVSDFLRSRQESLSPRPPPPPPPLPPPPLSTAGNDQKEKQRVEQQLLRHVADAKETILAKDSEIQKLRVELERSREEVAAHGQWRDTTVQYAVILINAIQSSSTTAKEQGSASAVRDSTTRLCATLATHLGLDVSGPALALPLAVSQEVRRRSTIIAQCFSPAHVARRRSLFSPGARDDDEDEDGEVEAATSPARNGPPPFVVLGNDEDAAETLFNSFLLVQREAAVANQGASAAENVHYIGRRVFLLMSLVLGLVDNRATLTRINAVFDRAAHSLSSRGQVKFSARLQLNDFVSALSLIADIKYGNEGDTGIHNARLARLLQALLPEAQQMTHDAVLRTRWIDAFSPCVESNVLTKLMQYQTLFYTSYSRAKNYGLFSANPLEARRGERSIMRTLGLPADTLLSSSRRIASSSKTSLSPPRQRSPPQSPAQPTTATPMPQPRVSAFEVFCANSHVVPEMTQAALPRRIAQFIRGLEGGRAGEEAESFRGFLACIAYLGIALSDNEDDMRGSRSSGFPNVIDKLVALVDAGVVTTR